MSALLTAEERHQANFLLGPWLIGSCIDLLLQGVLLSQARLVFRPGLVPHSPQFVSYFSWYSDDKRGLKIVVAVLVLLTVLKSIQAFAVIWIMFIKFFGDIQGAILLDFTAWWQSGTPLMASISISFGVGLIGSYVQSYFCFRLWVISKKWYVVAPIVAVFLFALLSIVVGTYFISTAEGPKIGQWFAAHLSATFGGDIVLSMTTAYFLLKSKKNVLPQTVGLISALVRLTFQTAAPAALCAMFNLIFSQIYTTDVAIISTAFNMALPKLYAISMMWTLNARRTIRAMHGSRNGITTTSNELSGGRSRARRPNGDMELGQIQIVTQTEQHVDVRDMFDPAQKNAHLQSQGDTKSEDELVRYTK
ncbi:hypothetical protein B0H19DRAFT_1261506 [Mycena capillaripes]|nr:hypothetical protein B0H19DRAFT_1261506 [Mycena capillaripes]